MDKKALDNISCNVIVFDNFINTLNGSPVSKNAQTIEGSTPSHNAYDLSFSPKKTLPPLNRNLTADSSSNNFDLTAADMDHNHSEKSVEYILTNMNKINTLQEGQSLLNKFSNEPEPSGGLFSKSINKYGSGPKEAFGNNDRKSLDRGSKQSYKLPNVLKNDKPYIESFNNPKHNSAYGSKPYKSDMKALRTIESKDRVFDSQSKTRHHTQPRNKPKAFGFSNDYRSANDPKRGKILFLTNF